MAALNLYTYLKAVHSDDGPDDTRVREVLTQLALHRNRKTGKCNPGTRRLAEQSTMSRSTVRAKLDDAEALGWIRRTVHDRGGRRGALTSYELHVPDPAKRAGQSDPLPDSPSGPDRVTRSPESKRADSEGQAGRQSDQAGRNNDPSGPTRPAQNRGTDSNNEQIEQQHARARARVAGHSTETDERRQHEVYENEFDAIDIIEAAKLLAEPHARDAFEEWIVEHGDEGYRIARGLRLHVDEGKSSSWKPGTLFRSTNVFDTPGILADAESAYWRHANGLNAGDVKLVQHRARLEGVNLGDNPDDWLKEWHDGLAH